MTPEKTTEQAVNEKVGIGAYLSLAFAVVFFSGLCASSQWWGVFDFTTVNGGFGRLVSGVTEQGDAIKTAMANFRGKGGSGTIAGTASNFQGSGGFSARAGFLFSLNLFPGVMLAMGLIEVLSFYGALRAAQVILTPLLKPILGVPGYTGLALITDLQSTDGGAAITRALHDEGRITTKNLVTICAWQYTGAGCVSNYYSTVSGLFTLFTVKVWIPMALILVLKFVGGALVRTILSTVYRKDFEND